MCLCVFAVAVNSTVGSLLLIIFFSPHCFVLLNKYMEENHLSVLAVNSRIFPLFSLLSISICFAIVCDLFFKSVGKHLLFEGSLLTFYCFFGSCWYLLYTFYLNFCYCNFKSLQNRLLRKMIETSTCFCYSIGFVSLCYIMQSASVAFPDKLLLKNGRSGLDCLHSD